MTVHQRAREAAMPVECKKDVLKQNQDGTWKLTLTIAPDGLPDDIMRAMPGTRYQTAFVEVGDDEEPAAKVRPEAPEKPGKLFKDYLLSQQAGMRCHNVQFQKFLNADDSGDAADIIRHRCAVVSRAKFDSDPMAAACWEAINAEYEQWAGLAAEDRP